MKTTITFISQSIIENICSNTKVWVIFVITVIYQKSLPLTLMNKFFEDLIAYKKRSIQKLYRMFIQFLRLTGNNFCIYIFKMSKNARLFNMHLILQKSYKD